MRLRAKCTKFIRQPHSVLFIGLENYFICYEKKYFIPPFLSYIKYKINYYEEKII